MAEVVGADLRLEALLRLGLRGGEQEQEVRRYV